MNQILSPRNSNRTNEVAISCTTNDGKSRPYRIVIFVDSMLLDVFLNWIIYFSGTCNLNTDQLEIVSMDKNVSDVLNMIGLSESKYSFNLEDVVVSQDLKYSRLSVIWFKRMEILGELIMSQFDVIFTDSDALWVRDPVPTIAQFSRSIDIISSRGWYPQQLREKWGACLCMGFIFIRAGNFGKAFSTAILHQLQYSINQNITVLDDQVAANVVLDAWNITWRNRLTVDNNKSPDIGDVMLGSEIYRVTLLPQSAFIRKCHKMAGVDIFGNIDKATVVHCLLPIGNGREKEAQMEGLSLWKLRQQWKDNLQQALNASGSLKWSEALRIIARDSALAPALHSELKSNSILDKNGTASFVAPAAAAAAAVSMKVRVKRYQDSQVRAQKLEKQRINNSKRTQDSLRQMWRVDRVHSSLHSTSAATANANSVAAGGSTFSVATSAASGSIAVAIVEVSNQDDEVHFLGDTQPTVPSYAPMCNRITALIFVATWAAILIFFCGMSQCDRSRKSKPKRVSKKLFPVCGKHLAGTDISLSPSLSSSAGDISERRMKASPV